MGVSTFMIAENEIVLNTAADAKTGDSFVVQEAIKIEMRTLSLRR